MAGKSDDVYQEIPHGFVYLWKQAGWLEAGTSHSAHFTLMKRAGEELHDGISGRKDDRAA